MKKTLHAILLVLPAISMHLQVQSRSVYVKHYTTSDGLAGNHVYMCHQDNDGYMWIATTSGLSRFDGKKFKNYGHEDGLSDNEVLFVTHDAGNNIWVKTFSAVPALSVIENTTVHNHRTASRTQVPLEYDHISEELYSARNKVTYLNGTGAIIRIKEGDVWKATVPIMGGSPLFETDEGKFFSGDGRNLYAIHDTVISFFQSLGLSQPYTRLCYYKDILYAVAGKTIYLYTYRDNTFTRFAAKKVEENINHIHANQYGVWLTFIDKNGVHLYKDNRMRLGHVEIPVVGIVNHIMTDNEGAVWICTTDNGVFYIPDPDMVNYTVNDGLASSVVYTLDPLSSSTFWAGYNTGNAGLVDIRGDRIDIKRKISLGAHKYGNDFVLGIVHSNNNKTYILSRNRLLAVEENKILASLGSKKSLLMVNDSVLGVGAWNYALLNLRTLQQDVHHVGRIYAQGKDSTGNLWLGGINGLYYLPLKPGSKPVGIKGLEHTRINALAVSGSYVWAGSQNNGLFLVKGGKVISQFRSSTMQALPSNNIKALATKGAELWIGTNRGILHTSFDYLKQRFTETSFLDHNDGLLSPEVNDIKIFDSSVFIATYDGVTIIGKLARKKLHYTAPDVFIRAQGSDDQVRNDSVAMPYSTRGLEVGIQVAAFKYANDITYRYMLKPFDPDWKTTKNNLIQYTNIPPGNYTFIATAFDNRGNASTSAIYRFIYIRPLYWQTVWFKTILVISTLVIAAFIIYWYFRVAKKRMNEQILQGRLIARARLEVLRSQLKPHFIFNSLNAIKDYIYNNKNDDAAHLLQGFAGLVRKGLHLADEDFITIAEETGFLKQYLELERSKCDACFDYSMEVPGKMSNIVIPSLITQPFVENAIIHGVRSVKNKKGVLHITYSLFDTDVVCCIADNGIGINQSLLHKKTTTSKGSLISRERINYFKTGFGIQVDLDIKDVSEADKTMHGTIITITIRDALKLSKNENRDQNADHR